MLCGISRKRPLAVSFWQARTGLLFFEGRRGVI